MRAHKIFRQPAPAISYRALRWPTAARQLDARFDAFAGAALAGRTARRFGPAGARFFAKGSQGNFRVPGANSPLCHSRFGGSNLFR